MIFKVTFDCEFDIVEAAGFEQAIEIWRTEMAKENNDEDFLGEIPESVELVSKKSVMRRTP